MEKARVWTSGLLLHTQTRPGKECHPDGASQAPQVTFLQRVGKHRNSTGHKKNPSGARKQAVGTVLNNRRGRAPDCPTQNIREPIETKPRPQSTQARPW